MATAPVVAATPGRPEAAYGLCYGTASKTPSPIKIDSISKLWLSPATLSTTNKVVTKTLDHIISDPDLISKIKIFIWIDYKDLESLAADEKNAEKWVATYVKPYKTVIGHVCVGDVIGPRVDNFSLSTFQGAMINLKKYLSAVSDAIKLSTIVNASILFGDSYTAYKWPSTCVLTDKSKELLLFLSSKIVSPIPLFVAIMPYFRIERDRLPIDNCILDPAAPTYMHDSNFSYNQAFDAMVDSIYCALKGVGELGEVDIIAVSGWPTKGDSDWASDKYARQYIGNLVQHIGKPTPRKNKPVDIFIYSQLDEDQLDTTVDEFKHLGAEAYLPSP